MQSLLTLPFLGGSKLVWLKNASFFADSVAGRSESVLVALEKLCGILISGFPDGVSFLLSAPLADKRRAAFRSLSKLAATQIHDLPDLGFRGDEEAIVEWTTSRVRERDLQLDSDALEILAARVGLDTLQLESELEKLETAFGNARPVTADDVRILVPQTREGGIFDLSEAVAKTRPVACPRDTRPASSARRTRHRHPLGGHRADRSQSPPRERSSRPPQAAYAVTATIFLGRPEAPSHGSHLPPPEKKGWHNQCLPSRNCRDQRGALFASRIGGRIRRV